MPSVLIPHIGQTVQFPEDASPQEIMATVNQLDAQHQSAQRVGGFRPLARSLYNTFAGPIEQYQQNQAEQVPYPTVRTNTFGLNPQQLGQVTNTIAETNQANASTALRQRAMREQAIEQEKQRAKDFQLEKMRNDNALAEADHRYKQQLDLHDKEARAGKAIAGRNGAVHWVWEDADGQPHSKLISDPQSPVQKPVNTVDANGNPVARIPTPEELNAGVPLWKKPDKTKVHWDTRLGPNGPERFSTEDTTGQTFPAVPKSNAKKPAGTTPPLSYFKDLVRNDPSSPPLNEQTIEDVAVAHRDQALMDEKAGKAGWVPQPDGSKVWQTLHEGTQAAAPKPKERTPTPKSPEDAAAAEIRTKEAIAAGLAKDDPTFNALPTIEEKHQRVEAEYKKVKWNTSPAVPQADKEARAWADANSTDPKAASVKARLKEKYGF